MNENAKGRKTGVLAWHKPRPIIPGFPPSAFGIEY